MASIYLGKVLWWFWELYRLPLPCSMNLYKFHLGGGSSEKNCLLDHPLEVETFFRASAGSRLSLATLPKSAPNNKGRACEKYDSSTRLLSFRFSSCNSVFLHYAAKCCEVFPRRTRAVWVFAIAASGVRSPDLASSSIDTKRGSDLEGTGK